MPTHNVPEDKELGTPLRTLQYAHNATQLGQREALHSPRLGPVANLPLSQLRHAPLHAARFQVGNEASVIAPGPGGRSRDMWAYGWGWMRRVPANTAARSES